MATFSKLTSAFLIALSFSSASFAADTKPDETKPKYGPQATRLTLSHQYVAQHPAPDFWALIPFYAAQDTGSACSIASVTMTINGARSGLTLSADTELATQKAVRIKSEEESWSKATGENGHGVNLDELGKYTERAFKAHGFPKTRVIVVHADDTSPATAAKLHEALVQNEKSANDFIILNFLQGVYTGDADVGHIAPIGAYDAKTRRVLVMDPDRTWYEPYWVSEETLLKGMNTRDSGAGKFRGYVWVHTGP